MAAPSLQRNSLAPVMASYTDAYGNTFEHLVHNAVCGIVNSDGAWRYEPDHYPPLVIKAAVARMRALRHAPIAEPGISRKILAQLNSKEES